MRFVSLLSGGFTTIAVINPPERKLAKRISVQCAKKFTQCSRGLFYSKRYAILSFPYYRPEEIHLKLYINVEIRVMDLKSITLISITYMYL